MIYLMKKYILALGIAILIAPLATAQDNPIYGPFCPDYKSESLQCFPNQIIVPNQICTLSNSKSIPPQCQAIYNSIHTITHY